MNTTQVTVSMLVNQFVGTSTISGMAVASKTPSGSYVYGPYCIKMPTNPFNGLSTIKFVASGTAFSSAADGGTGWLYKKETAEFKLNYAGTDPSGVAYTDY